MKPLSPTVRTIGTEAIAFARKSPTEGYRETSLPDRPNQRRSYLRIVGELKKLHVAVSRTSVATGRAKCG